MGLRKDFSKGFWKENPVLRLVLGICPTLAVTTTAINGLAMGLATTGVLVMSNCFISLFRKLIPEKVRIPIFIVVIASFVTITDKIMAGFFYELHKVLGLFIPLIVVNCIILGRAEAFASRNPLLNSFLDGLGMGLGFTASLVVIGSIREILGQGSIFGIALLGTNYQPFLVMLLPPGAFITLGLLLGLMNRISK
ncbi:electron transport complex subunit E [bacterium]|nr:electron transport complex subunit E [bacterium]MCK4325861.1 electron transport complex subunit E [bacterium]MCK4437198.1 electron transport complex subunit E [bacterium]